MPVVSCGLPGVWAMGEGFVAQTILARSGTLEAWPSQLDFDTTSTRWKER